MNNPLARLSAQGQSVWIDYLSRDLLESGEFARLMREDSVVGVTSNPTIFERAISEGSAYDTQLKELLAREADRKEISYQLVARDMASATDLLQLVWEASGHVVNFNDPPHIVAVQLRIFTPVGMAMSIVAAEKAETGVGPRPRISCGTPTGFGGRGSARWWGRLWAGLQRVRWWAPWSVVW